MFKKKYNAYIIDSKWNVIKNGIKLDIIPRKDEFIYIDFQYHQVLNVVHRFDKNHDIFIVVSENSKETGLPESNKNN